MALEAYNASSSFSSGSDYSYQSSVDMNLEAATVSVTIEHDGDVLFQADF